MIFPAAFNLNILVFATLAIIEVIIFVPLTNRLLLNCVKTSLRFVNQSKTQHCLLPMMTKKKQIY